MVLATLSFYLHESSLETQSHKCSEAYLPGPGDLTLDPIKLTVKINHHEYQELMLNLARSLLTPLAVWSSVFLPHL